MAKKNLLSYLETDEIKTPVLLSQEEINKTYSSGSELINTNYTKYKNYLQKDSQPVYDSPETWDEKRAKFQSGFEKVLNSTGQMTGTFGTALASTVATLGGAVVGGIGQIGDVISGEDNTDFMDTMINNPVMKGISDFDKFIKEDIVPTYYTKEQQESVFSANTGTDLLNGIGFMASAILPNAAITKLFGSLGKMAATSKLGKLESTLAAAVKTGDITTKEAGIISKTANFLNKSGPVIGATVGRIGESSMEAYQTYESMLANGASEEEAKQGRNNVFMGNMALAASDLAQYTRWFKGASLGDDLIKKGLSTTVKEKSKTELIGGFLKEAGQEAAEEGYQFLLSKGAEKATKGKSFIDGISEASGDLFTTTEGLKSMLLGAVLGGGMGAISQARNSKKHKQDLANMANELTSVGDTTQRFIETEDGKRIINPEITKIATQFVQFEQLKDNALAIGDQHSYNVLEKMQFSSLVEAKNRAGQFDEFIDQLESMGRNTPEEIKAMFGELPMKNGREMTPMEVATEKIQQAKQIKQTSEGLDMLPQLTNISPGARSYIKNKLFTQEALREEIFNLNTKIAEVQSRAKINPAVENGELFEPELAEWDQLELNDLLENKKALEENFLKETKEFKEFITKPKKAEDIVEDIQNTNVKEAIKTEETIINKDNDLTNKAKNKLQELKDSIEEDPIEVEMEDGKVYATLVDDILVNAETGEPIEEELLNQFKKNEVDKNEIDTNEEPPEEYEEDKVNTFLTGPQKPSTHATSTRGLDIEYTETGSRHIPFINKVLNLLEFQLHEAHAIITKWFSNPKNTPSDTKKFTAQLTEVPITQELLDSINNRRATWAAKNLPFTDFRPLTLEDLQTPKYKPLRMWLYENGKPVKASEENAIHFHDVDYFYDTQAYTNIMLDENLSNEDKEAAINKEIAKLTEERAKLIANLDVAFLTVDNKSNGVLNFLPNISLGEGKTKRQVLPISNLSNQEGSYGIGFVESFDENGVAQINYNGNPFDSGRKDLKLGELVFDIISANSSHLVNNNITKNKYTPEQIDSIAELLIYKITSGSDEIIIGNEKFNIKELLKKFIFLGINENKSEYTIAFNKAGDELIVGRDKKQADGKYDSSSQWNRERAIKDRVQLKKDLVAMLSTNYHVFPNPTVSLLNNKSNTIVFPTEINELGEAKGNIIPIQDFFLNGENPMIGTNINPNIPFINSYFSFEINGGGLVFPAKEEEAVPYASNLESELKPELVNETDELKNKKADIEKRTQEANNKNEKFWEQFTAINAEEVADRDNLINKLTKDIPLPANTRINNWVLEELNGKLWEGKNIRGKEEEFFGKENWDKIKEAKKQFDIEFKKIEDSNLAKIKLIEQKQSDLLNTADGIELRRAWSLGLIAEPNIVGLDETNFISKETELKKNGDLVETDNYEGYYYLSKPNKDEDWYEIIIGKTEQEVENKINDKYDAELTTLESKTEEIKDKTVNDVMKKVEETDPCMATKVNPETNTKIESNGKAILNRSKIKLK